MNRLLSIACWLVLATACAHSPRATGPAATLATIVREPKPPIVQILSMRRDGCWSDCPIYEVSIDSDGTVRWDGIQYVMAAGGRDSQLDATGLHAIEQLVAELATMRSFNYHAISEGSTVVLRLRGDFEIRTITHYDADPRAPDRLFAIEHEIDRLVGVERWIGTEAEHTVAAKYDWMCNGDECRAKLPEVRAAMRACNDEELLRDAKTHLKGEFILEIAKSGVIVRVHRDGPWLTERLTHETPPTLPAQFEACMKTALGTLVFDRGRPDRGLVIAFDFTL